MALRWSRGQPCDGACFSSSAASSSRSWACAFASTSRPSTLVAPASASAATSLRSASRARDFSFAASLRAAVTMRSLSATARLLASPTSSFERLWAMSTTCTAFWRASVRIASEPCRASASSFRHVSPAVMPSAISLRRFSMTCISTGQMNFMLNQTKTIIAIVCPISVRLKSIELLLPARSARGRRLLQLPDERVREGEEERDADADHRDRVEQRDDDKHLRLQHRRELGLACGTLEEAAAEQAHADADAQRAEADEDRDSNRGKTNHSFHRTSPGRKTSVCFVRLRQVHDRQHHENERLQQHDQHVEHGPREVQGKLVDAEQRDQHENELAGVEVAEEPQRQRHGLGEERYALEREVERHRGPVVEGRERQLLGEAA